MASTRQKRRAQLSDRIEAHAIDLFERNGYEVVTVADIAEASDISTRTFFRYFATKDEVLFSGADDGLQRLSELISARPAAERPFAAVRAASLEYAAGLADQLDMLVRREGLATSNPAIRRRERARTALWATRIAEVLRGRDPTVDDLTLAMVSACPGIALAAAIHAMGTQTDRRFEAVVAAAFDALSAAASGSSRRGLT